MSDADDTRVENNELLAKEQASLEVIHELLRNFHHRVAIDGSKDFNALQYLQGIAANTSYIGMTPNRSAVVTESDTAVHTLISCLPNQRIYLFDLFLSINAAGNMSFEDQDGTEIFATMYAPNAGQGFVFNSVRGFPLPRSKSLIVQCSTAVNYSVTSSYCIVEDVEKT